jgi:hypothetical protein
MGQGRDQAKQYLHEHPEAMKVLREKILASKGIGKLLMSTESNEEREDIEAEEGATPKSKVKKSAAKH